MKLGLRFLRLSAAIILLSLSADAQGGFHVLYSFGAAGDGSVPSGPPVLDASGNIYGATAVGGAYSQGTVFELKPDSGVWNESILHNFDFYTDGEDPLAPLALDSGGNVYGATRGGGPQDLGSVFELSQDGSGWSCSLIYDSGAHVGLISGKAGKLYGFLGPGAYVAGAIADLSPGAEGWAYTALYSFCSLLHCADGEDPLAPPSWDSRGNLYGTTYDGGAIGYPNCKQGGGCGVAFQLTSNRSASSATGLWTYEVIHRFASTPTDGQEPYGSLTVDANGNVFGTTAEGGLYNDGTVFELKKVGPSVWLEVQLYDFPTLALGGVPGNNLVFDQAGNLYGVAGGGDLSCPLTCGVVFKLAPEADGQWTYSVVHFFDGDDGDDPLGLAIDANGNLFGTTQTGGTYNRGVVFEITP